MFMFIWCLLLFDPSRPSLAWFLFHPLPPSFVCRLVVVRPSQMLLVRE